MSLDRDRIASLYSKSSTGTNKPVTRFFKDGSWQAIEGKLTPEMKGTFHGNVGSMRRSRKGRTYRLPNGSRWYPAWNDEEVQAYRA